MTQTAQQITAEDLASTLKVLEVLREDLDGDGMVDERDMINVAHGLVDENREGLTNGTVEDVITEMADDNPKQAQSPEAGNMVAGMRPSEDVPDGKFESKTPNGAGGFRVAVTAYATVTPEDWEGIFAYFAKNRYYPDPRTLGSGSTIEFQAVGQEESE